MLILIVKYDFVINSECQSQNALSASDWECNSKCPLCKVLEPKECTGFTRQYRARGSVWSRACTCRRSTRAEHSASGSSRWWSLHRRPGRSAAVSSIWSELLSYNTRRISIYVLRTHLWTWNLTAFSRIIAIHIQRTRIKAFTNMYNNYSVKYNSVSVLYVYKMVLG